MLKNNTLIKQTILLSVSLFFAACQSDFSGKEIPLKVNDVEHSLFAEGLTEIESKAFARMVAKSDLLPATSQSFQVAKKDSVEITAAIATSDSKKVSTQARYCRIGYLASKQLSQKVGVFFKGKEKRDQVNCASLEYKWMDPTVPRASAAQAQMALMEELHFFISLFSSDDSEEAKNLWKSIPSQLAFTESGIQVISPEQVSVGVKELYTSDLVLDASVKLLSASSKGIVFSKDAGLKAWVEALKIWRGNLANLNAEEFEPGLIEGVDL